MIASIDPTWKLFSIDVFTINDKQKIILTQLLEVKQLQTKV
jgi:hypothetical protein